MKKRILLLSLALLGSACAQAPKAEDYFNDFKTMGESLENHEKLEISTSSTSMKLSFVDSEGADLEVYTTPLVFKIASDNLKDASLDSARVSFTMADRASNRNTITVKGTWLKKQAAISAGSTALSIDAYLQGGNAYVDFKSSSLIRTAINEVLRNAGYEKLPGNQVKFASTPEIKKEIDGFLPLTQYLKDISSTSYDSFVDIYASSPDSFTFTTNNDEKSITVAIKNKETAKKIAKDLIKEEQAWTALEDGFDYAKNVSLDYEVTFSKDKLLSTSFAFKIDTFDIDAMKADNPDAGLYPSNTWTISSKLDFDYKGSDYTLTFPSFDSYREYSFEKTEAK